MTETAPPIQGPPAQDFQAPQPPPKRGPGRPKGSKTKNRPATGAAPKRGGSASYQSRRKKIGGTLTMFNMALQMTPLSSDRLDPLEIDALAKSLDEEARKSPTFRKYLDAALGVTGAGGLWSILGLIAIRRGARHGILPAAFDAQGAVLLQMAAQSNEAPTIHANGNGTVPFDGAPQSES